MDDLVMMKHRMSALALRNDAVPTDTKIAAAQAYAQLRQVEALDRLAGIGGEFWEELRKVIEEDRLDA